MIDRMKKLFMDEEGATMVEYALIIAVIAIVALVGAKLVGNATNAKFGEVNTELGGAAPQ